MIVKPVLRFRIIIIMILGSSTARLSITISAGRWKQLWQLISLYGKRILCRGDGRTSPLLAPRASDGGNKMAMIKWRINLFVWLLVLSASELFASWWLWTRIPTDTVRLYYPTAWSYVGEHFLIWLSACVILTPLVKVAIKYGVWTSEFTARHCASVVLLAAILEVSSSSYRWWLALQDGSRFPWWEDGLAAYLSARALPVIGTFIVGMTVAILLSRLGARNTSTETAP
jgi:hypothetical protein